MSKQRRIAIAEAMITLGALLVSYPERLGEDGDDPGGIVLVWLASLLGARRGQEPGDVLRYTLNEWETGFAAGQLRADLDAWAFDDGDAE